MSEELYLGSFCYLLTKNLASLILVANAAPLHETNNLCYAPLHEKFLGTEIFLVFIFPYLDKKKLLEKRSAFCLW